MARLHAVRTTRQATAQEVIAAEIARNPVPPETRRSSHLYVVAQPLASPPDLLTSFIGTGELRRIVTEAAQGVPSGQEVSPNWGYLLDAESRAEGHGYHTPGLLGRRFVEIPGYATEAQLLDVEVWDDGRVALFCDRASDAQGDDGLVIEGVAVVLTRCLVALAGKLGERGGYAGRWLIAVGVDDLAGKYTAKAAMRLQPSAGERPRCFQRQHLRARHGDRNDRDAHPPRRGNATVGGPAPARPRDRPGSAARPASSGRLATAGKCRLPFDYRTFL